MPYNYLIIGQGIAGSTLALQLLQNGKTVMVLDDHYPKSSSRVAAGLFNPVTGKQFTKTWKADVLFPELFTFYQQIEKTLGAKFFFPMPMYRPFDSIEKQNIHLATLNDSVYQHYILRDTDTKIYDETVYNEFGGMTLQYCGYVDTNKYLEAVKQYLLLQNAYKEIQFIDNELFITENIITYQDITADKIIFCRGRQDSTSPLWQYLPFKAVKGELLYVEFENGNYTEIINRGCWILPMPTGFYKVGATYNWDKLDEIPTEEGRNELVEKLEKLTRLPYKITKHLAGVRPASHDRKPFIGLHPNHKNVGIFNGFGTKGVSLVPYFAKQFVDFLVNNIPLDGDVNVTRVKR